MEELVSYLKHNHFKYHLIGDNSIEIDGKTYQFVKPKGGKHFDKDFNFLAESTNRDRYVYLFGGRYYWLDSDGRESVDLNPFRYIGKADQSMPTDMFLGVHGEYELLNGSGNYSNWTKKAKFFGVKSLGICEKNTLAGTAKFQKACEEVSIKPIFGATYTIHRESKNYYYDVTFYVKDLIGWYSILELNKAVNVDGGLTEDFMLKTVENLVVVLDPKELEYDKIFPINLSIDDLYFKMDTVEFRNDVDDERYLKNLQKFFADKSLKPLPISDAYYLEKSEVHIKFKLNVIGKRYSYLCKNQYFKNKDSYIMELFELFGGDSDKVFEFYEQMVDNEAEIANSCNFKLKFGLKHLPPYILTSDQKKSFKCPEDLFWYLIERGLSDRKISKDKVDKYLERLGVEMETINRGGFIDYFLNTWDIVSKVQERGGITGSGRGSSAGCLISYLLRIVEVDPLKFDLLFERFLNDGRLGIPEETDYYTFYGDNGEKRKFFYDEELAVVRDGGKIVVTGGDVIEGDVLL